MFGVSVVITSSTTVDICVYFDGREGDGGEGREGVASMMLPRPQLLLSFFCLISAVNEGSDYVGKRRGERAGRV